MSSCHVKGSVNERLLHDGGTGSGEEEPLHRVSVQRADSGRLGLWAHCVSMSPTPKTPRQLILGHAIPTGGYVGGRDGAV